MCNSERQAFNNFHSVLSYVACFQRLLCTSPALPFQDTLGLRFEADRDVTYCVPMKHYLNNKTINKIGRFDSDCVDSATIRKADYT